MEETNKVIEIKECKYRLPCGRCDKYDKDCDIAIAEMQMKNDFFTEPKKAIDYPVHSLKDNCIHNWELHFDNDSSSDTGTYYVCSKCGTISTTTLEILNNTEVANYDE